LLRVVAAGAVIGILGGLIGLGGAEFRLPLLIRVFGFVALQDVILNKALSLVVVITALPARLLGVPYSDVSDHWGVIVTSLLAVGSVAGIVVGGLFLNVVPSAVLIPFLAAMLLLSSARLWQHE